MVSDTILATEKIDDGTAVNLGTMDRIKAIDAVHEITRTFGHHPKIELHPEIPTGSSTASRKTLLLKNLLGWEPKVMFHHGVHRTIDW